MKKWYILMLLMSLWFIGAQAQETVRGVVTDAAGEPLIGANVVEKGQPSNGTITNLDGKFTLKVTSNKAIIAISMIGMKTVEVTVPKDGKTLTVRLHDDTQTLDEVVVVAYGQQKKVSVTGSISAVGNRELKQGPTSSVTNSLTGRIPGLVTRQTSGRPGEDAAALYIRGRATVNDASPLIMVDGIERDFSQIDPDEIESISVLKDASATAVYGVRGANGVILVTTKRGNSGKAKVSFSGEFGITQINRITKMVNAEEYATLMNEGLVNNTTMKQFDLNMKMLNQSLKSLKTNFMPTLGMNYSYQYQSLYNNNWNVFDYNWGGSSALVFTLNIPLYKASNFTKLKTARIQINQLKENRTDTERKLNMQITSYQNNMAASSEQVVSNKENVMQAQKAVEIAGKRYEVGKGTVLELNSSQVSLTQAELTYNQSIYDYLVSKADLDQVLGRDYSTNK